MDIIATALFCIAVTFAVKLTESSSPAFRTAAASAAAAGLFIKLIPSIRSVTGRIEALCSGLGTDSSYLVILLKGLGICYITKLTADICRDSGESALVGQAETAGRIALLVTAMPLFSALIELVTALLE
ncbi:MAG: hypothetical protein IJ737_04370 [Ruminococcus sp.]|nr:hypothetical protein [Ruminococcus sp.]